uniref:DnaB-like helicase C-terminal domain-containing protein n=1 Tax=Mycolicibacterium sp. TaxID=2320850 RepID=UPI0037C84716
SRQLADDVTQLLLRVGVYGRIARIRKAGYRDCWHVWIDRAENQKRFLAHVGVHGARGTKAREVLQQLEKRTRRPGSDTVPHEVWNAVRTVMQARQWTNRDLSLAANVTVSEGRWKHDPGRSTLHRVAAALGDRELHDLATNDVFWDKIIEIKSVGTHDVYDGTVPGTHNFVANLVSLHNSLEQDADMVMLLHRPDAFDREDPRGGEADIILGKHRNGPTATITVAHQLHLSRFTNMAR